MFTLLTGNQSFLGVTESMTPSLASADAIILPFGLEKTVSYGKGTANAPCAIIHASQQVELFDEDLMYEPTNHINIVTASPPTIAKEIPAALHQLEEMVETSLTHNLFPLVLGGEHTITAGAIKPFLLRHPDLLILHFDAHADLRDQYAGEAFSHACAMRRCLDNNNTEIISIGIRNISSAEIPFYKKNKERIHIFWAKDKSNWRKSDLSDLMHGRDIYLSFDLDAFDASLMPATGTPEPGGLFWYDAIDIIQLAANVGNIVGADINELAPIPHFHSPNFIAAKLAYKIISLQAHSNHSPSTIIDSIAL